MHEATLQQRSSVMDMTG